MAPTHEDGGDGGEVMREGEFSRDDIDLIREILAKAEQGKARKIFTDSEIETLKRIVKLFDEHKNDIEVLIKQQQVSRLWAEVRLRWWSVAKWALGTFLLITAAISSWREVIQPIIDWSRK